jgi:CubicO group peptidase (beta-lactamase class C family)
MLGRQLRQRLAHKKAHRGHLRRLRLSRVAKAYQTDVDKGLIPGAVFLIARNGKVAYLEAVGFRDRDKKIPMTTDAIFQIASALYLGSCYDVGRGRENSAK